MKKFYSIPLLVLGLAIIPSMPQADPAQALKVMVKTEQDFNTLSETKGMRIAFLEYLAGDGILFRPYPVPGKQWVESNPDPEGKLTWTPVVAEIAGSAELGYTSGPWKFIPNAGGEARHGNYVSIWRKQPDGEWKVVVDGGTPSPAPKSLPRLRLSSPKVNSKSIALLSSDVERGALTRIDRLYSEAMATNPEKAFAHIDDQVRYLRPGVEPILTKTGMKKAVARRPPGTYRWQSFSTEIAESCDFGYFYGMGIYAGTSDTSRPDTTYYIRIWKRKMGSPWRLVLDMQ